MFYCIFPLCNYNKTLNHLSFSFAVMDILSIFYRDFIEKTSPLFEGLKQSAQDICATSLELCVLTHRNNFLFLCTI